MGKNIAEMIRTLTEPVAKQCGVSIWDVEYVKEGGNFVLRITIDSPDGIDSDKCYRFTELANPVIDEADPSMGTISSKSARPDSTESFVWPNTLLSQSAMRSICERYVRWMGNAISPEFYPAFVTM